MHPPGDIPTRIPSPPCPPPPLFSDSREPQHASKRRGRGRGRGRRQGRGRGRCARSAPKGGADGGGTRLARGPRRAPGFRFPGFVKPAPMPRPFKGQFRAPPRRPNLQQKELWEGLGEAEHRQLGEGSQSSLNEPSSPQAGARSTARGARVRGGGVMLRLGAALGAQLKPVVGALAHTVVTRGRGGVLCGVVLWESAAGSALAGPLGVELLEVLLHEGVPLGGRSSSRLGAHQTLELQELLAKMVQGGLSRLGFLGAVLLA